MGRSKNKNSRKKYQDKALDLAKALIRQKRDPEIGISALRQSYSAKQLIDVVPKLISNPAYRTIIANKPFPEHFGLTGPIRFMEKDTIETEISWLCGIFSVYSEEIRFYLSKTLDYEFHFLNGDKAECEIALNLIKSKLGVSLSLLERDLQVVFHFGDYGEKEKLIEKIKPTMANTLIAYSLIWYNLRIDRSMSPEEFSRLVEQILPNNHHINSLFRLLQSKLGRIRETDAVSILATSHLYPLIDRYEILVNLMIGISSEKLFDLSVETVECLKHLKKSTGDLRLKKLLVALGVDIPNDLGGHQADAMDVQTRVKNPSVLELVQIVMSGGSIDDLTTSDYPTTVSGHVPLLGEIRSNLIALSSCNEKSFGARSFLQNLCSVYVNQSWASTLQVCLEHQQNNVFIFPPTPAQTLNSIRSFDISPLLLFSYVPKDLMKAHLGGLNIKNSHSALTQVLCDIVFDLDSSSTNSSSPIFEIARHTMHGRKMQALEIFNQPPDKSWTQIQIDEFHTVEVKYSLLSGNLRTATSDAARQILRSSFFGIILPIEEMAEQLSIDNYKPFAANPTRGRIPTSIIFDVYSRTISTTFDVEKADSYKDVLSRNNVANASELPIESTNYTKQELYHFLRHICTPDVLDQSLEFQNTTDVEDERVSILVKLNELKGSVDHFHDAEIKEELTEISTRQVIRQTAIQLEQSKIYVNIDGIRRKIDSKLHDTWARFKSAKYDTSERANNELKDYFNKNYGGQLKLLFLNQPITERRKLLESIIRTILTEFTLNKEFGLNSNLSANIRHGYVLRELRRPFVKNRLVTNKNTDSGVYLENKFLAEESTSLTLIERELLTEKLSQFSAKIDHEIDHLNKKILRINTSEFPEGLFEYTVPEAVLDTFHDTAEEFTEFDKFSWLVYEYLWDLTEHNLKIVRGTLAGKIAHRLTEAVDGLRDELEQKNIISKVPGINNSLVNAKLELRHSIQSVSNWFTLSKITEYQDYNLQIAFEAGLRTIRTYFIDTEIEAKFVGDDPKVKGHTLPFFARLFFLLLDNAGAHGAEQGDTLKINVISELDNGQLMLKVTNSLRRYRDIVKSDEAISKINCEYGKSLGLERIGEDSGSGYPKIWNLLQNDLNLNHDLTVCIEDDVFTVEILIEVAKYL